MTVRDNAAAHRYEIDVDGELAGFVTYVRRPGVLDLVHTETFPGREGQGIGSTLVAGALDDVRRQGLRVAPTCPFVRAYIARHPEYQDLVA